jgi:glucose-6-phosphate isomerase
MNMTEVLPGPLAQSVKTAIQNADQGHVLKRIWSKDASLWKNDEADQKLISNSLGWLTVPDEMLAVVDELNEFAAEIRNQGFQHVMVCGMGGSSLCPEVLARTFGRQEGYPELLVLDSTDPDTIADLASQIEIQHCLFIIASKSGTTTEPNVFYKFWYDRLSKLSQNPGDNFVAITDPGSPMVDVATELKFKSIFLNQADIGGRYSALSYFGMVPAALMGIDVKKLLERAKTAEQQSSAVMPASSNSALRLGLIMGESALAGRDKLTLVLADEVSALGLWIEQLIAESTGKEGKGILPVVGEPLGTPDSYGTDRLFVSISVGDAVGDESPVHNSRLKKLAAAGHPVVFRKLTDLYDLGAEFFTWEFATACAGWSIGINPFDQPNVQESKDATKHLLQVFKDQGQLPQQKKLVADHSLTLYVEDDGSQTVSSGSVTQAISALFQSVKPNDYIAFLVYTEETPRITEILAAIRMDILAVTRCATTIGFGPRFLHSTGQFHKGGPDTGVFFQLTADDQVDFPVPGEPYSFSVLKQAQALGDFQSLAKHRRRAIRVDLGNQIEEALHSLREEIRKALSDFPMQGLSEAKSVS